MKKSNRNGSKEILEYMLTDYQFLQDYQIIENPKSSKSTFLAQIKNTSQRVRFIKKRYSEEYFPRFKALCRLYKNGIVLADNMFVIEECEELYFYIIEAELEGRGSRFCSLARYLYEKSPGQEERRAIISKIKILIDCLHQEGEAYAGMDTRSIVIDDENHLYFVPFQLEYQLRTDGYSRAYYPTEILGKISKGNGELDQQSMMKWDYWSFGCIMMEILCYHSPIFLETSLAKQQQKISKQSFNDEIQGFEEPIKNIITNCLQKDPLLRSISTSALEAMNQQCVDLNKTIKTTKKVSENEGDMTELNIYKDAQAGDSQLVINLLSLQGISFKEELHIIVSLNKKYHFYLDQPKENNRYKLNKKITIHADFKEFAKMLESAVTVELKEGSKVTKVPVNLQTLVMMHGGRRLWNKKLLGTYKPLKDSVSPQAKLKVSCILTSPEIYVEQLEEIEAIQPQISQKTIKIESQPQSCMQDRVLSQVINLPLPKKKKSSSKPQQQIPSISEISNNITLLTQTFMQRLSLLPAPAQ